jgi:hypothetical protein
VRGAVARAEVREAARVAVATAVAKEAAREAVEVKGVARVAKEAVAKEVKGAVRVLARRCICILWSSSRSLC